MHKRRDFIKTTLLMTTGTIINSASITEAKSKMQFPGIIYSAESPGKWSKKVDSHVPKISVEGKNVTITTSHGMTEQHYIVRHTLISSSLFTLSEKYDLMFYATSFCNKHDLWVAEFK